MTVVRHLDAIGKVNKLEKWVPYEPTEDQKFGSVKLETVEIHF